MEIVKGSDNSFLHAQFTDAEKRKLKALADLIQNNKDIKDLEAGKVGPFSVYIYQSYGEIRMKLKQLGTITFKGHAVNMGDIRLDTDAVDALLDSTFNMEQVVVVDEVQNLMQELKGLISD